ncbi:MAG TPA: alkaline shock response membrane anchor protein AmaP [Clostridia bacterium]|nr:alkaline shock response membrane anchor protein AmaP [Clostridia bacterium]
MKISLFNRLLLTIYTLVIAIMSIAILAVFAAIGANILSSDSINSFLAAIQSDWRFFLIGTLVSVFFLIVSVKLLFTGTGPKAPSSALLKHTDLGIIRISLDALEVMTHKAVNSFDEVRDSKIGILNEADGVKIRLKVSIMPDVILQDLSVSIQQKVKEYVEGYSGILVKEVFVYIDNLAVPQQRAKVQ